MQPGILQGWRWGWWEVLEPDSSQKPCGSISLHQITEVLIANAPEYDFEMQFVDDKSDDPARMRLVCVDHSADLWIEHLQIFREHIRNIHRDMMECRSDGTKPKKCYTRKEG